MINNVAVAAKYAQVKLGMKKILIVDWDGKLLLFTLQGSFYVLL